MSVQQRKHAARGFTLTELMIVIALMMIIAALGMPALQNLIHRTRVEGAAREATLFVQRARMEATKSNNRAVVEFDFAEPSSIRAFIDMDGDGVFNPDLAAADHRSTDFEIARYFLPSRVSFIGPAGSGADAIHGFSTVDSGTALILLPDGTVIRDPSGVAEIGDIDIGDARENYLRISLGASSKANLAKWNRDESSWQPQDEAGEWKWY